MQSNFEPVIYAQKTLVPMLDEMIVLSAAYGSEAQVGFYEVIRDQLAKASDPADVAEAFVHLSSAAFLGFEYGTEEAALLDEILSLSESLAETLSIGDSERH